MIVQKHQYLYDSLLKYIVNVLVADEREFVTGVCEDDSEHGGIWTNTDALSIHSNEEQHFEAGRYKKISFETAKSMLANGTLLPPSE